MEVIELEDGLFIAPEHVTMVKKVDENKCLIFFVGQTSMDGHELPYSAEDVAEAIENSFIEENEADEDENVE